MQQELRTLPEQPSKHEGDNVLMVGLLIIKGWLAQFLRPAPLPNFVHAHTGEPLLFTTDHYEVQAWPALEAVLAAQTDVHPNHEGGWDRLVDCEDRQTRSQATIARDPGGLRLSLLYKTTGLAQQGAAVVRHAGRRVDEVPAQRSVGSEGFAVPRRHFREGVGPVAGFARGA